jgi:hypothetical protein
MDDKCVQRFHKETHLPIEIIYMILAYVCEPQSPNLLEDISSFSQTMAVVSDFYYNKWVIKLHYKKGIDICWLENDMILYANEDVQPNVGMQPKFNNILGRLFSVKNIGLIFNKYANNLTPKTRARILWGLLTVSERGDFIKVFV